MSDSNANAEHIASHPPKSPVEHEDKMHKTTTIVMSAHTLDTQPQVCDNANHLFLLFSFFLCFFFLNENFTQLMLFKLSRLCNPFYNHSHIFITYTYVCMFCTVDTWYQNVNRISTIFLIQPVECSFFLLLMLLCLFFILF